MIIDWIELLINYERTKTTMPVISDGSRRNYKKKARKLEGRDGPVQSVPITKEIQEKFSGEKARPTSVRNYMQNIRTN